MQHRRDITFCQALAEVEALEWEAISSALEEQKDLERRGESAVLSELLRQRGALNQSVLNKALAAQGKAILYCARCRVEYPVKSAAVPAAGRAFGCPKCKNKLGPVPTLSDLTIERAAVLILGPERAPGSPSAGTDGPQPEGSQVSTNGTAVCHVGRNAVSPLFMKSRWTRQRLALHGNSDVETDTTGRRPVSRGSAREPLGGRLRGRYEILEKIGSGGMGVVYKARQVGLDRVVALKVLRSDSPLDEEQIKRFYRESQAAAKLQHRNIVAVHDVGFAGGAFFFAMDYVEGMGLDKMLKARKSSMRDLVGILADISEAVDFAHRQGVVHRDLKPANVLVDKSGRPFLTDFGLAKEADADSHITVTGSVMGTPMYMSPEQALGKNEDVDERSDVYSLGVILYEILVGRPPFVSSKLAEVLWKTAYEMPRLPSKVKSSCPRELEAVCMKALEKRKARRYYSAGELAQELRAFLAGKPVRAKPSSSIRQVWQQVALRPGKFVAAAVALVAVSVAGYVGLSLQRRAEFHQAQESGAQLDTKAMQLEDLVEREKFTEALALADELMRYRKTPRISLLRARALEGMGKEFDAVPLYQEYLAANPADSETAFRLGAILAKLKRHSEAAAFFKQALGGRLEGRPAQPGNAAWLSALALTTFARWQDATADEGLMREAEDALTQAIAVASRPPDLLLARARLYSRIGKVKQAAKDMEAAMAIESPPELVASAGIIMLDAGEIAGALRCRKLLQMTPAESLPRRQLEMRFAAAFGRHFAIRGSESAQEKTAEELASGILRDEPGNIHALRTLVECHLARANRDEAKQQLAHLPQRHYDEPVFLALNGRLHESLRQYDKAAGFYGKALQFSPHDAWLYYCRGRARAAGGDTKTAVADWKRAYELRPDWRTPFTVSFYGKPLRLEAELAAAEATVREKPSSPEALLGRACLLLTAGDVAGAIKDSEAALSAQPGHPEALLLFSCLMLIAREKKLATTPASAVPAETVLPRETELVSWLGVQVFEASAARYGAPANLPVCLFLNGLRGEYYAQRDPVVPAGIDCSTAESVSYALVGLPMLAEAYLWRAKLRTKDIQGGAQEVNSQGADLILYALSDVTAAVETAPFSTDARAARAAFVEQRGRAMDERQQWQVMLRAYFNIGDADAKLSSLAVMSDLRACVEGGNRSLYHELYNVLWDRVAAEERNDKLGEEALGLLNLALENQPQLPRWYYAQPYSSSRYRATSRGEILDDRAAVNEYLGRLEQALEDRAAAIVADKKDENVSWGILQKHARCLLKLKRHKEAIIALTDAIEYARKASYSAEYYVGDLLLERGEIYLETSDPVNARKDVDAARVSFDEHVKKRAAENQVVDARELDWWLRKADFLDSRLALAAGKHDQAWKMLEAALRDEKGKVWYEKLTAAELDHVDALEYASGKSIDQALPADVVQNIKDSRIWVR